MISKLVVFVLASFMLTPFARAIQTDENSFRTVQRQFLDEVKPILRSSCGDCHWGSEADAELDFSRYESLDQLLEDSSKFKRLVELVSSGEMPPDDAEPLTDADKMKLLSWVDHLLNTVDCSNLDPGRVTIRRLNATEYRNTIRDLVGVDYQPSEKFPGDDVGYGFDNIADVLSLPPILMEKYLDAAETITSTAIIDPQRPEYSFSEAGAKFRGGNSSVTAGATRCLFAMQAYPVESSYRNRANMSFASGRLVIRLMTNPAKWEL